MNVPPMATEREIARAVLADQFATRRRVAIVEVLDAGHIAGVSGQTLRPACLELGIPSIHNGQYPRLLRKKQ